MHDPEASNSIQDQLGHSAKKRVRADVRAFWSSQNPMYLWRAFATCYGPGHPPIPLPPVVLRYFLWCRRNLGIMANEGRVSIKPGRVKKPNGDAVRRAVGLAVTGKNYLQMFARSAEAPRVRQAKGRPVERRPKAARPKAIRMQAEHERHRELAAGWVESQMRVYRLTGNPMYLWRALALCHLQDFPEIPFPADLVSYLLRCWNNLRRLPGKDKGAPSGDAVRRALELVRAGKNQVQMFALLERKRYLDNRDEMPDRAPFEIKNPDKKLIHGPIGDALLERWRAAQFDHFVGLIAPESPAYDGERRVRDILDEGRRLNGRPPRKTYDKNSISPVTDEENPENG
jgi:hypothetical protein